MLYIVNGYLKFGTVGMLAALALTGVLALCVVLVLLRLSRRAKQGAGQQAVEARPRTVWLLRAGLAALSVLFLLCCLFAAKGWLPAGAAYGTGMYTTIANRVDDEAGSWHAEVGRALTGGALHKTIPLQGSAPTGLLVQGGCETGALTLEVTQGEKQISVDITDAADGVLVPLDGFAAGQDITLAIRHTAAEGIDILVQW